MKIFKALVLVFDCMLLLVLAAIVAAWWTGVL